MNKAGLIDVVHEVIGDTKTKAEKVVETIIETIATQLKKGDEVAIAGLGTFVAKQRAARMARNPKTGAAVSVPAVTVPKFKPAKALKDAVK